MNQLPTELGICGISQRSRMVIRELCEALGARVVGYVDDCLCLYMKPSEDRRGWSAEARTLDETLEALGFVRQPSEWRDMCTVPNDPHADARGYYFPANYRPSREPFGVLVGI